MAAAGREEAIKLLVRSAARVGAAGRTFDPRCRCRSVEQRLFDEGSAFDFFQAVRSCIGLHPDRARVGRAGPPAQEAVRFRVLPSLSFPPSSIHELRARRPGAARSRRMTVSFLGLTGPSGVLPRHYTEQLLPARTRPQGPENGALRDWLDLFNHRMISLFYRAWEKYRFWIAHERGGRQRGEPTRSRTRCTA